MIGILLFLASLAADPEETPQAPPDTAAAVVAEPHRPQHVQAWEGYWKAKVNWRYHLAMAGDFGWWDRFTRGMTIVLSAIALVAPLAITKRKWQAWLASLGYDRGSYFLFWAFIWPYGEWASNERTLAARWNQASNEWYTLYEEQQTMTAPEFREKFTALQKESAAIESDAQ